MSERRLTKSQINLLQAAANNEGKFDIPERSLDAAQSLARRGLAAIAWRAWPRAGHRIFITFEGRQALAKIPGSSFGDCVGGVRQVSYSSSCMCDRCLVAYMAREHS